jgi:thioesterase domain-containing protein
MPEKLLAELQSTIEREIPMCAHMGIRVHSYSDRGLTMRVPLERNHNHKLTAFAGSLNALCTVVGWGSVFLLLRKHRLAGDIVIRRSEIKYLRPVDSPEIFAFCGEVGEEERLHFVEMLRDKGQSKIDLRAEITANDAPAVSFSGSYVVLGQGAPRLWTGNIV